MEMRPFVYVVATYLLTSTLVADRRALRAVLWALVVCVALKAAQGLLIFVQVRHMNPRPESVLGHEESFFFALLAFLVLAMWLWRVEGGRLRATATALLPRRRPRRPRQRPPRGMARPRRRLLTLVAIGLRGAARAADRALARPRGRARRLRRLPPRLLEQDRRAGAARARPALDDRARTRGTRSPTSTGSRRTRTSRSTSARTTGSATDSASRSSTRCRSPTSAASTR